MEQLFNILIAVVIIYSFLSPLFRKKKKGQAMPPSSNRDDFIPRQEKPRVDVRNSEFNLMKEFENMFGVPTQPPVTNDLSPEGKRLTRIEKLKLAEEQKQEPVQIKVDEKLEVPYVKPTIQMTYLNELRSKLRNSATAKDLFIGSIIFGKPKARRI